MVYQIPLLHPLSTSMTLSQHSTPPPIQTNMEINVFSYLKSIQRVDPAQQPPSHEEAIQVKVLGVQTLAILQAVAKVVELGLSQRRGRTQDHLMPGRRQVGLKANINPHSTQAE